MENSSTFLAPGDGAATATADRGPGLARRAWQAVAGRPPRRAKPERRPLSLALQGGGSFGAFTWGVLDRLLAEGEGIEFDVVSGTSAGAVNAVLLADGLAAGGPEEARRRLERFWTRLSAAAAPPAHLRGLSRSAAASAALHITTQLASPYQFNPFGLDPLRDHLAEAVDFERLRAASPVRLLIAATRVRDGRARLFREHEVTLDAVLASACLPFLHHAVEIDGEAYWDGAYSANPPLRQLVLDSKAADVLLVRIAPEERDGVPRLSPEITRRSREIAFGTPLRQELAALDDLREACAGAGFILRPRLGRKLRRLRLHHVAAEDTVEGLARASPLDLDGAFLSGLKESGERAADEWLARGGLHPA